VTGVGPAGPGPATTPVPTGAPGAGDLLGGRYLLQRAVRVGPSTLWQAEDEILARPVAVRVLDLRLGAAGGADGAAQRFLAAAVLAGRATGPLLASVLDAAHDPQAGVAYVVAEWVDGRPLADVLVEGPLEPAHAAALTRAVAVALVGAHARGVHSRRLHPGQVLLCPGGGVKLTDLEVAAAVRDLPPTDDPVGADTVDLGRLLHASLTATWPGPSTGPGGWAGLPPTPSRDGRPRLPRQVRAGLPRETDAVVARALDPRLRPGDLPLTTPAAVAEALAPWPAAADVSAAATVGTPRAAGPALLDEALQTREDDVAVRPRRRWLRLTLLLLLLALVGVGGWAAGLVVGGVPNSGKYAAKPVVPGLAPSRAGATGSPSQPLRLTAVTSFDPQSDDKTENEAAVGDATDGDATTSWSTEHYLTPAFGNLKGGVGLLVDLGTPQPVGRVVVVAPAGEQLQLYAAQGATAAPATLDALSAVTTSTAAVDGDTTLSPSAPTTARWWVVWLTTLPMDQPGDRPDPGHPYSGHIAEMAFYPR